MKETPKCAGCSYMGWPVPRRITGNNRHCGRRRYGATYTIEKHSKSKA